MSKMKRSGMDIPPYKIHNVLKVYMKRLIQDRQSMHQRAAVAERHRRRISDDADANGPDGRKALINRISENLIGKARAIKADENQVGEKSAPWQTLPKEAGAVPKTGEFVYYAIGKGGNVAKHTLRSADSGVSANSFASEKESSH